MSLVLRNPYNTSFRFNLQGAEDAKCGWLLTSRTIVCPQILACLSYGVTAGVGSIAPFHYHILAMPHKLQLSLFLLEVNNQSHSKSLPLHRRQAPTIRVMSITGILIGRMAGQGETIYTGYYLTQTAAPSLVLLNHMRTITTAHSKHCLIHLLAFHGSHFLRENTNMMECRPQINLG